MRTPQTKYGGSRASAEPPQQESGSLEGGAPNESCRFWGPSPPAKNGEGVKSIKRRSLDYVRMFFFPLPQLSQFDLLSSELGKLS